MAKPVLKKKLQFWGTGRRKKSIARVRLIPGGGKITINKHCCPVVRKSRKKDICQWILETC